MEWKQELKVRVERLKILRENQKNCYEVLKRYKDNEFVQEVTQQTRGMIEGLTISINSIEELIDLVNGSTTYQQNTIKVVENEEDGSIFMAEESFEGGTNF